MTTKEIFEIFKKHPVITTDSRRCEQDSIFIALKGESFDGNRFAMQALEKGCSYAIVDDKQLADNADERLILVDDALQTYKDLARMHRLQYDIPVIAITGTNGKTTTKELIAAVVSRKFRTMATEGNFNNDVGVPKTLMRIDAETEVAIVEMGASHPGDIKTLAATAVPTHGLITNVGVAHLEGFGSLKGVVQTKGELYADLAKRQDTTVFINADDSQLLEILPDNVWVTPYSTNPDFAEDCITGRVKSLSPLLTVEWRKPVSQLADDEDASTRYEIRTNLIGAYNVYNVLAAVSVGINFGISPEMICEAIENYRPTNSRSELVKTDRNTLIVDAYNANPSSMKAALDNFENIEADNKMLILGQMNELGAGSDEEHRRLVNLIRQMKVSNVWLIGKAFADIKCHYRKFETTDEAKKAIEEADLRDQFILIKGSNSLKLAQLADSL